MKYTESKMWFDFTGFLFAQPVDIPANKFDGASIVDFIAESDKSLLLVETKNYVNLSDDLAVQAAIDKSQAESFYELTHPVDFARRMIKKLEHGLFVWVAAGNQIRKPISMLLVFNTPPQFTTRERDKLLNRLRRYIPESAGNKTAVLFDMPTVAEVNARYEFNVTVQP
ncbi:MAG: hypothetical protein LBK98_02495 [Peptococcaceae bacterium]|jgi:hypothetical protein|nr:hypothetical protein [Peptococcaceae bacterium]